MPYWLAAAELRRRTCTTKSGAPMSRMGCVGRHLAPMRLAWWPAVHPAAKASNRELGCEKVQA
jgi:hypothetical protein